VGIEADSDRVDALLKELEGKDITEVIASGVSKLASVPAGGGAVAASGGARYTIAFMLFNLQGHQGSHHADELGVFGCLGAAISLPFAAF
jgi:hypothetical protein